MGPDIEKHANTKAQHRSPAPGRPGITPSWNTGAKTAVGTALNRHSRIWFTIAHGYLNEIYFPDIDRANTRFIRFLVSGDRQFFSDEATDTGYSVRPAHPGVPAYYISTQCNQNRYRMEKEIITDPDRDAVLMRLHFEPLASAKDLRVFVFANPHVGDEGEDNSGWTGEYKGIPMLFAERGGVAFAIACSSPFKDMSCGFMGVSDGSADIRAHGCLTTLYTEAKRGNIGLTAEVDWRAQSGDFILALACGERPPQAGQQARAALMREFGEARKQYVAGWNEFHAAIPDLSRKDDQHLFRMSVAVSRIHESKRFPGAFVASLSIPWGFDRGDKDVGGYHVIWPRDLCETALALLACGDAESARRALFYLECTQERDGHWHQNMWLDGSQHWTSRQMDETAFPILLADALRREGELKGHDPWPMVQKTAAYLVQHGPVAEEDRWEAVAGYATFTIAVEIAALLAAADFAALHGEMEEAQFLRETADAWNETVDELTYAEGTELAQRCGVAGYYVRVTPPEAIRGVPLPTLSIDLRNHPEGKRSRRAVDIVSPDALALVRYGMRAADDPRILDTAKVIDAELKIMTATGPVWRRYTDDGYGEHKDGSPFRKTGIGRGWPLLAGERAHYELANADFETAEELRRTIGRQTSECGLIPEQIWDAGDIPEHELYNGHPSGSGMPLVWAHSEYLQLLRSLQDGKVWSTPPQTVERYIQQHKKSTFQIWTFEQKRGRITAGEHLRVDSPSAGAVEWTLDCWKTMWTENTRDSGFGVHWALLNLSDIAPGARVRFRFRGIAGKEEEEFEVIAI